MSSWPRPVCHFQVLAKDPERQAAFYRELFDWDIAQNEAGITVIGPGKGPPEEGIGGSIVPSQNAAVSVYVQVADLGESLRKAEELGGKALTQPFDVPGGPTIAQIADPEGNLIGLVQM
ncbi:MAG: VOC family protein [Dehalococcoidia bacterium]|nr:VOC family protein [Dehalococcoidia bacterium]MDZ4278213.1 VOC family protein [Dehalococcoidia bacterium]